MVRVKLGDVSDALQNGNGEVEYWLDQGTGEVHMRVPYLDDDDDEESIGDWVRIPEVTSREGWELMERFALGEEDEHLRDELLRAISGKGAFKRFGDILHRWPGGARERWHRFRDDAHDDLARRWLAVVVPDIEIEEPVRPLRPTPPEASAPQPQAVAIGLVDMLVLGAPDGKTEILDGRVPRVFVAQTPADARKVFLSVAREAYEWSGFAWRRHFGEGRDVIEVGRYRLEIEDALVHLDVAVEPGVVRRFYDG